ncbi:hypothetical protein B296_00002341 [Ensete ventricosum]|uniref:Protein kinase domain-containing protein n=1 Tax=Ensete ventricosum TaxID=4639 RepID=A0A427B7G6_ENSVE|nr:hypothetical protein B296_00002341 [Ensete ventricosum]
MSSFDLMTSFRTSSILWFTRHSCALKESMELERVSGSTMDRGVRVGCTSPSRVAYRSMIEFWLKPSRVVKRPHRLELFFGWREPEIVEQVSVAPWGMSGWVVPPTLPRLAYLHRRKSAHRDFKPSSLLIDFGRRVKIADFTVGRILAQTMDPCDSSVGTIACNEPREDRHRPQPQGLRRLHRQHLELRPQQPRGSSSASSHLARTSIGVSTEHSSCVPSAAPICRPPPLVCLGASSPQVSPPPAPVH